MEVALVIVEIRAYILRYRCQRMLGFCEHFTRWFKTQKRSMRQLHVAGDKLFIDYCGPRLQVVNLDTGEVREAEVFVATLGACNYTYVEAFPSQGKSYWLEACECVRALRRRTTTLGSR